MKGKLAFALLAMAISSASLEAGMRDDIPSSFELKQNSRPASIKVLIADDIPGALIEVKGKYNIYDPYKRKRIDASFFPKRRYIQAVDSGLKWGESFPGIHQIAIIPDDLTTTTLVDGIEYRGSIYVYEIEERLSIVNEVSIEDYVHSLISSHIEKPLKEEALAAFVIAARTDAYYTSMKSKHEFWQVDAKEVNYQGYGVVKKDALLERVMASTEHLLLTRSKRSEATIQPIPCKWSLDSSQDKGEVLILRDAEIMAEKGYDASRILTHVFRDTHLEFFKKPQPKMTAYSKNDQKDLRLN